MNRKLESFICKCLFVLAAVLVVGMLAFIVMYIIVQGIGSLTWDLFSWVSNSENNSLVPSLINTLVLIALVLLIALPIGIFSAIYLEEYADPTGKISKCVILAADTLTGIPSIVYGLFGMLFFNFYLNWGYSLLSGGCTLAMMVLPVIMKTTQEALKEVPMSYRQGSYGLGAGKVKTIFAIVLPSASKGILAGIILAMGRILQETAALIYTAGTVNKAVENLFSSTRTLAVHMYILSKEAMHTEQAFATALVLLVLVLFLNALSSFVVKKISSKKMG